MSFKLFIIDRYFEKTINSFCENNKIIKWELLGNTTLGYKTLIVEYVKND